MSITRLYLRASTKEQDASRALASLTQFASSHSLNIVSTFIENESGAKLERPELFKLIADSKAGDILLCESIDRLTRLSAESWGLLKTLLNEKQIRLVIVDLPTTHMVLNTNELTDSIMQAINNMLIDIMASMARKDYLQRRERAAQGLAKAKAEGKLTGRKVNAEKNEQVLKLLQLKQHTWNEIITLTGVSRSQIAKLAKSLNI